MKLDIETIGLFLTTVGVLELVLQLNLSNVTTLCIFVFMVSYCMYKFKDNILGATISTLLMFIVVQLSRHKFNLFIMNRYM